MKRRFATVGAGLCLALCLAAAAIGLTRPGCEGLDFKWASARGRCVTPLCVAFHDCGEWAYPVERFDRVLPGAPAWRLFFELGEPASFDGGTATFAQGKASGRVITATLKDGVVLTLDRGPR